MRPCALEWSGRPGPPREGFLRSCCPPWAPRPEPWRVAPAALGPGPQPSARPSVWPAVGRLRLAARGARAKPAHLSSAGAASTFKSRSSFSFTFCLLPGPAPLTWGLEPPPIGCHQEWAGRRRDSAPSTGTGRELAVGAASAARGPANQSVCARPAPRKLERGGWQLRGLKLGSRRHHRRGGGPPRVAFGAKPRVIFFLLYMQGKETRWVLLLLLCPGFRRGSRSWGRGPCPFRSAP